MGNVFRVLHYCQEMVLVVENGFYEIVLFIISRSVGGGVDHQAVVMPQLSRVRK